MAISLATPRCRMQPALPRPGAHLSDLTPSLGRVPAQIRFQTARSSFTGMYTRIELHNCKQKT